MKTRKLVTTGVCIALGYILASITVPLGFIRAAPFQHFMNIVVSFLLGPWYSLAQAFGVSILRNITGTGSPLAFPGSMVGAFLSGFLYWKFKKFYWLAIGELVGSGIIGALLSYPVARLVMQQEAALFGFVPVFFASTLVGTIMATALVLQLKSRPNALNQLGAEGVE